MFPAILVFIGGGLGSVVRYGVSLGVMRLAGPGFPLGTMLINIVGSFLMGIFAGWFALRGQSGQEWRLFIMTGLLGGFTTFSAFSLEAMLLYERGDTGLAALYVVLSVVLSIAGLVIGLALIRALS